MNTRHWGMGGLALALVLASAATARAGAMASVVDLGTGGVLGIDNAGEVLRYDGLYRNGTVTPVLDPATGQKLPALAAISPGGTIAYNPGGVGYSAVMMTAHVLKDGRTYDAGTASDGQLAGGDSYSLAHAVNDAGAVAGDSHAYGRWNRAFTSAPEPDGKYHPVAMGANGGSVSTAMAINNSGTVVGWSDVAGQWRNHAFVGTPGNDIGTLGGLNSYAQGINDKGQVVGASTLATDYKPPAQPSRYYDPGATHAFLYINGKMTDLGTRPGFLNSGAVAINNAGQIVGSMNDAAYGDPATNQSTVLQHAALFHADGGLPTDLNDLLAPGSGWLLKDAVGINDAGQIIGHGTYHGEEHSYLLALPALGTPQAVPEPTALALFGLAGAGLIARRQWGRGPR